MHPRTPRSKSHFGPLSMIVVRQMSPRVLARQPSHDNSSNVTSLCIDTSNDVSTKVLRWQTLRPIFEYAGSIYLHTNISMQPDPQGGSLVRHSQSLASVSSQGPGQVPRSLLACEVTNCHPPNRNHIVNLALLGQVEHYNSHQFAIISPTVSRDGRQARPSHEFCRW